MAGSQKGRPGQDKKTNEKAGEKPGFLASAPEKRVRNRLAKAFRICWWHGTRSERPLPQVSTQAEVTPSPGSTLSNWQRRKALRGNPPGT